MLEQVRKWTNIVFLVTHAYEFLNPIHNNFMNPDTQ